MPVDAIPDDLKTWFDLNVALKGMAAETIAAQPKPNGPTTTRAEARRLTNKASADVAEMERNALKQTVH